MTFPTSELTASWYPTQTLMISQSLRRLVCGTLEPKLGIHGQTQETRRWTMKSVLMKTMWNSEMVRIHWLCYQVSHDHSQAYEYVYRNSLGQPSVGSVLCRCLSCHWGGQFWEWGIPEMGSGWKRHWRTECSGTFSVGLIQIMGKAWC